MGGVQAGADDKTQGYLRAPWGEKGRCEVWTVAHHDDDMMMMMTSSSYNVEKKPAMRRSSRGWKSGIIFYIVFSLDGKPGIL